MVLVLFLLGIVIFVEIVLLIILLSTLKANIQNKKVQIGIYLFGKIPIIKINLNKKKINERFKKIRKNNKFKLDKDTFKIIKKLSTKIERLDLDLKIGTEDAAHTAFAVWTINTAISVLLPYVVERKNYSKIKYQVKPIYNGKKQMNIKLNSIIYVKMVHIISIIYIVLRKRRDDKYGRASNRRAYAHSYE